MSTIPDRVKLRRNYLRKKGTAYTLQGIGFLIAVPALTSTFFFGFCILWAATHSLFGWGMDAHPEDDTDMLKVCGVVTLVSGLIAVGGVGLQRRGVITRRMPYVPPVTASTLPAEETLVRASEEPTVAQSEILLRAAHAEQETPQQELLRGSQG